MLVKSAAVGEEWHLEFEEIVECEEEQEEDCCCHRRESDSDNCDGPTAEEMSDAAERLAWAARAERKMV